MHGKPPTKASKYGNRRTHPSTPAPLAGAPKPFFGI